MIYIKLHIIDNILYIRFIFLKLKVNIINSDIICNVDRKIRLLYISSIYLTEN